MSRPIKTEKRNLTRDIEAISRLRTATLLGTWPEKQRKEVVAHCDALLALLSDLNRKA